MIIEITGVKRDASHPPGTVDPLVPYPQEICLPRGEQLVINLTVKAQDYSLVDIGSGQIVLEVRARRGDAQPLAKAVAALVVAASGTATITVTSTDTLPLSEQFQYIYDVQWTDGNGSRWQLVPVSRLLIAGIVGRPGE